ncbi:hypothetical protein GIB67_041914 [Kingdonia uniflora]|uniref:Protein GAMETE EXPRESSED 3 n=1 Tax=Kingdonia uniflora TaxID=39325 RepID=A0A7J7N1F5_9MAGN|nr:hypothetical protein GIB67_041914 [Kingdonia uniflora]
MSTMYSYLIIIVFAAVVSISHTFELVQEPPRKTTYRLSNPLIGDDGKIYTCSERNFFAFESNGSIAWTIHLNYSCHVDIAPIRDERGKVYLIAENRVLKVDPFNIGTSESTVEVFFGDKSTSVVPDEIIGISIGMLSSALFINVKNRGLFAYMLRGQFLWSAGPVLYRSGYRQGCWKNITDCYFTSAPVVDQCEGSIYISNAEGELYSVSSRSPHFNWIQDLSMFDKFLIISPGNNGRVYVTFPAKSLVLALEAITGKILWQNKVGPLSTTECSPVVDSNGWISIGSLDGFLYSYTPSGVLKKFPRAAKLDLVVQVSPVLDCSGYAVYMSQTEMKGKTSHMIGENTYISAMKPVNVIFSLLVPATGYTYWTGKDPGRFLSLLPESDLRHFALDERILLAIIAAGSQKLAHSCSRARPKHLSIYTGNLESYLILMVLLGLVRFCIIFWRKKKLQGQDLGRFLEKRRSLRVKKKAVDRTITELEKKAAKDAMVNEVLEKLGDLVKEKKVIERKLSTTYSLGRDRTASLSKPILPLYDSRTRSYSFQGRKKESVTIFHTLSDTSSKERSSSDGSSNGNNNDNGSSEGEENWYDYEDKESAVKAKVPTDQAGPSNNAGAYEDNMHWESPLLPSSGSRGYTNPLFAEHEQKEPRERIMEEKEVESMVQGSTESLWLKRRSSSPFTK